MGMYSTYVIAFQDKGKRFESHQYDEEFVKNYILEIIQGLDYKDEFPINIENLDCVLSFNFALICLAGNFKVQKASDSDMFFDFAKVLSEKFWTIVSIFSIDNTGNNTYKVFSYGHNYSKFAPEEANTVVSKSIVKRDDIKKNEWSVE